MKIFKICSLNKNESLVGPYLSAKKKCDNCESNKADFAISVGGAHSSSFALCKECAWDLGDILANQTVNTDFLSAEK